VATVAASGLARRASVVVRGVLCSRSAANCGEGRRSLRRRQLTSSPPLLVVTDSVVGKQRGPKD